MLTISPTQRIYVVCQAFDFRSGIDGLAAICRRHFELDPFSGHCFIFRNRKKTAIKILLYDNTGFWLCQKRLSKGQFKQWPPADNGVMTMEPRQLGLLLQQ
jgi:transposase